MSIFKYAKLGILDCLVDRSHHYKEAISNLVVVQDLMDKKRKKIVHCQCKMKSKMLLSQL